MPQSPRQNIRVRARLSLVAFATLAVVSLLVSHARWNAATAFAQEGAQKRESQPQHEEIIDDDEVLKIDTDLVLVEVNVTDAEGRPVRGLRPCACAFL